MNGQHHHHHTNKARTTYTMISTQKTLLFATTSRHCDKYSNQKRERENDIKIDLIVYCTAERGPPHQHGTQQQTMQSCNNLRDLFMSRPNDLILVPNRQKAMNMTSTILWSSNK